MKMKIKMATATTLGLATAGMWTFAAARSDADVIQAPLETDTYTDSGEPDQTHGNTVDLQVKTDINRLAYLRFDVSALPPDATINSATVQVFRRAPNQGANTLSLVGINDGAGDGNGNTEANFDEDTLTFFNRPDGTDAIPNSNTTAVIDTASLPGPPDNGYGTIEFGGTSDSTANDNLISFLENDTNGQASFVIGAGDSSNGTVFLDAEENTTRDNPPSLSIDFTPIPEPASLSLLGVSLLLLGSSRRSRSLA